MIILEISATNQAYTFLIFMINGVGIGIIFDIFRILRKSFKTSDFITYIEDIIFWILSGILTLYTIMIFNNGEIRLYIFIAILLGVSIYILTISKFIIKASVLVITTIKGVVTKIFLKPINFIIINVRKILSKPVKKLQKLTNKIKNYKKTNKNAVQKKDFNI